MDWRPISCETNVSEGDLVGVVGIREGFHYVTYLPETNSVFDMCKTWPHFKRDALQSVDGFSDQLRRIHGCVNYGVIVEGARFFGCVGDEPIHVHP